MGDLIPCPMQISTPVILHIPKQKQKKDLVHLDKKYKLLDNFEGSILGNLKVR